MFPFTCGLLLCLIFSLCLAAQVDYCPPLGPVDEVPRKLAENKYLRQLSAQYASTFLKRISKNITAEGFDASTTSFSVNIFSAHECESIFQYHFTSSSLNSSSTKKVDENTVYRIGSITKVVTVLALLLQDDKVHFDDPITKHIPELARIAARQAAVATENFDDIATTQWSHITVGALASQLAGIGRSAAVGDLSSDDAAVKALVKALGLPTLKPSETISCSRDDTQPPCSEQKFLEYLNDRHPVYAPFTTPSYSNAAFGLLGLVIKNVMNEPYEAVIDKTIFQPLGLSRTSIEKPEDSWGVIPLGNSLWDFPLGIDASDGALYSSTKDLSNLARAILKSTLLKPAQTRKWLKPQSHTASRLYSVGAPWEISSTKGLTEDNRLIDFYIKTGGLGSYTSLLLLIPDYDVALTVLTAGPSSVVAILSEDIIQNFLPAIEQVAKRQAAALYVGSYESDSSNSSIGLIVNKGPGLYINRWITNGVDFLSEYKSINNFTGNVDIRLYPTGLKTVTKNRTDVSFRAIPRVLAPEANSTVTSNRSQRYFTGGCETWSSIDFFMYGLRGLDEFIFHLDAYGNVLSLEPRAFRSLLKKRRFNASYTN